MQAKVILVACATALLSAVGQRAEAQTNAAAAQVLFDEAMKLMDANKYPEACPKLDESLRLDPAMGTRFRLAECYEKVGKIASAWSQFIAVMDEARQVKNKAREAFAKKRANALDARLPKLTIEVPPEVAALPGLEIRQENIVIGPPLWGSSFPVDPGNHVISAKADQKKAWKQTVTIKEGALLIVQIPALENLPQIITEKNSASPPAGAPSTRDKPSGGSGSGQRAAALAAGGVGVAGLVVGSIFGVRAFLQWDSALSHCPDGDRTRCGPEGIKLGESASTSGTISTVMFAVGGAGLAASVILWATAGSDAPSGSREESAVLFLPSVSADQVSGTVQMRF